MDSPNQSIAPEEVFFLFRPHTTGLLRPRKSKAFATYAEALSAGHAFNILTGTPDHTFVIISSKDMHTHTNVTDELPFSQAFYRLPRLSDSINKFKSSGQATADLDVGFDLDEAIIKNPSNPLNGLLINDMHPGIVKDSLIGLKVYQAFEKYGLTRQNIGAIQQGIQFKLGVVSLDSPSFPEKNKLMELCSIIFPSLDAANKYISQHTMKRMTEWGQYVSDGVVITEEFFKDLEQRK